MFEDLENNFSELLRRYSQFRLNKILEPLSILSGRLLENNSGFHYIIVFSAMFVCISVFAKIRNLTLFSLHPVCMSLGTLIFLAEAIG